MHTVAGVNIEETRCILPVIIQVMRLFMHNVVYWLLYLFFFWFFYLFVFVTAPFLMLGDYKKLYIQHAKQMCVYVSLYSSLIAAVTVKEKSKQQTIITHYEKMSLKEYINGVALRMCTEICAEC